jgi:hypothetical protein
MPKWLLAAALIGGFVAGASAQRAGGVSMRGIVMDANTIAEEIEYWELRTSDGESIVITGRGDLAIMRWLRQARNRPAVITVEPAGPGSAAAP